MELLAISEIAEKIGMTKGAVKSRLFQREIKPVKYLGMVGFYREDVIDKIKESLPTGKRSPKYGKIRAAIKKANAELAQSGNSTEAAVPRL